MNFVGFFNLSLVRSLKSNNIESTPINLSSINKVNYTALAAFILRLPHSKVCYTGGGTTQSSQAL